MEAAEILAMTARDPQARQVTPAEVEELERRYPFFTLPAQMLALADSQTPFLDPALRSRLLSRLALQAPDAPGLMARLDPSCADIAGLYPDGGRDNPSTAQAIDTFLDTYGHASPAEDALLERLIFNPTPDYATTLEREAADTPVDTAPTGDAQLDAINAFLSSPQPLASTGVHAAPAPAPEGAPAAAPAPQASHSLTESLAQTYIKQRRYAKALELLSQLEGTPGASPHLPDQLRFLRRAVEARGAANP